MMNSINLVGRLTADAEVRTVGDQQVADFSIAVGRNRKNEDGTRSADFIPVNYWGRDLTNFASFAGKGTLVSVSGELRQNRWTDQQGQNHSRLVVLARSVSFIDLRRPGGATAAVTEGQPADTATAQPNTQQSNAQPFGNQQFGSQQTSGTQQSQPFGNQPYGGSQQVNTNPNANPFGQPTNGTVGGGAFSANGFDDMQF